MVFVPGGIAVLVYWLVALWLKVPALPWLAIIEALWCMRVSHCDSREVSLRSAVQSKEKT
jgi:uncharacterized membrane protein YgaE (UPF0421/DUF939 family)